MPENFVERPHKNEKDDAIQYVKKLLVQAREDNRNEDIEKLEELVRLLHTKKYGLVWEEHAEIVEEEMKTKIPVFVEDADRKIVGNPDSEDYNFLLEGDNLHSLHLLEKTHAGKIDVIYIDPPYNTGNKDFIYNDKIVDKTDGYSHSKWLSFMSKRLEIARNLLSDKGVIFISIDDNEQAQLKLLCDEVFGETNFIAMYKWNKTATPPSLSQKVRSKYEYILCYEKQRTSIKYNGGLIDGGDAPLLNRGNSRKDILFKKETVSFNFNGRLSAGEYDRVILKQDIEIVDGKSTTDFYLNAEFKWTQETLDKEVELGTTFIIKTKKLSVRFIRVGDKTKRPADIISKDEGNVGTNESAKSELSSLVPENHMDYPKPTSLITYLIKFTEEKQKNRLILDFFAGSGTTGHAVAQLNKEDGGNRKYILCTNNENRIAEEVTYKRLSNIQSDLPHNLKYFKTDFVDKTEFPDFTLEIELLNYITPLVELEFGIDISNPSVQIILTEEHLEALLQNHELQAGATLFIHPDVFLDTKEQEQLSELQITLQEIPDYFFGKELWS